MGLITCLRLTAVVVVVVSTGTHTINQNIRPTAQQTTVIYNICGDHCLQLYCIPLRVSYLQRPSASYLSPSLNEPELRFVFSWSRLDQSSAWP